MNTLMNLPSSMGSTHRLSKYSLVEGIYRWPLVGDALSSSERQRHTLMDLLSSMDPTYLLSKYSLVECIYGCPLVVDALSSSEYGGTSWPCRPGWAANIRRIHWWTFRLPWALHIFSVYTLVQGIYGCSLVGDALSSSEHGGIHWRNVGNYYLDSKRASLI